MTKQGYTHIIVPKQLHSQLKTIAEQNNLSMSQLITQLVNISVNVNVSINTGINTAIANLPNQKLNQVSFIERHIPASESESHQPRLVEPGSPRAWKLRGIR